MAGCSIVSLRRANEVLGPSSALPGFRLTPGTTLVWLSLIVLVPLTSLALRPWSLGLAGVRHAIAEPRVLAALRLSFSAAAIAAAINVPFGLLVALVMVRYRFPGRNLADSLIGMPLALPTAVAGIALTALFAQKGWVGALLVPLGINAGSARLAHRPWTRLRSSLRVGAGLGRAIDVTAGATTMNRDKPTDETGGVEAVWSSVRRSAGRTNSGRDPIPADPTPADR
jgi:hypothetical protein